MCPSEVSGPDRLGLVQEASQQHQWVEFSPHFTKCQVCKGQWGSLAQWFSRCGPWSLESPRPSQESMRSNYLLTNTDIICPFSPLILSYVVFPKGCRVWDATTEWMQQQIWESCCLLLSQMLKRLAKMSNATHDTNFLEHTVIFQKQMWFILTGNRLAIIVKRTNNKYSTIVFVSKCVSGNRYSPHKQKLFGVLSDFLR